MKMTFKLGTTPVNKADADTLFSPFETSGRNETAWTLDKPVGEGVIKRIEVRPGFNVYIADYRVARDFTTCFDSDLPAFGFGFWLSGRNVSRSTGIRPRLFETGGLSPVYYFCPDQSGDSRDLTGSRRRSVSLFCSDL